MVGRQIDRYQQSGCTSLYVLQSTVPRYWGIREPTQTDRRYRQQGVAATLQWKLMREGQSESSDSLPRSPRYCTQSISSKSLQPGKCRAVPTAKYLGTYTALSPPPYWACWGVGLRAAVGGTRHSQRCAAGESACLSAIYVVRHPSGAKTMEQKP